RHSLARKWRQSGSYSSAFSLNRVCERRRSFLAVAAEGMKFGTLHSAIVCEVDDEFHKSQITMDVRREIVLLKCSNEVLQLISCARIIARECVGETNHIGPRPVFRYQRFVGASVSNSFFGRCVWPYTIASK